MKRLTAILLLLAATLTAMAQQTVTGSVTDTQGEPVPWAGVVIKGTTNGTATSDDGSFSLQVPDIQNTVLVISSIGYRDLEVALQGRTSIQAVLEPDTDILDNAVVIGYGSVRRKDLTGAVASIKSESLEDKIMFSVDDALKGGVPGLMVSSTSGQPGAASKMLVRGANSLSGSTSPLIVVDGFPLADVSTSTGLGMSNLDSQMSGLALINTEDIESIEVLKDASATAIYGNRGANGVILITTKKGRGSSGRIQYSGYVSMQNLPHKYDMMDFSEYVNYIQTLNPTNTLYSDANANPRDFDSRIRSVDWQDEIYRTGFIQSHNLSLSNSNDKTNFLISGSYMQNESIIIATNWQKFTAKAAVDHNFTDKFKVGLDVNYSRVIDDGVPTSGGNGTAAGTVISALLAPPFIMDEDTQSYFRRAGVTQSALDSYTTSNRDNPVTMANDIQMKKTMNRTIANAYMQYSILPDLVVKVTGGLDNYNLSDKQYYPKTTPRGYLYNGQAYLGDVSTFSWINENTITWSPIFGKHRLNVVAGITEQGYRYSSHSTEATSFDNEILGYNNIGMATDFAGYSSSNATTYLSIIGRANYSYDDRYIATFTYRRDGTSVFVKNKWGSFYSGALAWNISEEKFLKGNPWVSTLRLRLSIGEVGNANVPTSGSYAQLYNTNYSFGNSLTIGLSPLSLANESLTWEKTLEYNLGLEMGFFNDRLTMNLDLYDKTTRDLLLEAPVLNISGYTNAWQNVGSLRNRGIEFAFNAAIINNKNFGWNFSGNLSRNWSKILQLGQNGAPIDLGISCLNSNNAVILREGGSIGEIYGYRAIGLYQLDEFDYDGTNYIIKDGVASQGAGEQPGSLKLWDKDGNGVINDDDRDIIGNFLPKLYGAFSTDFRIWDFNIYLGFQYSLGNDLYNANYWQIASFNGSTFNQVGSWTDRWTVDNQSSRQYAQIAQNVISSSHVEDASYLRFQTARISYNFPSRLLRKAKHIESCRLYISGDNLYVFTKYSGYDPEVGISQNSASAILSQGFDYGNFPHARTFSFGVNISFK